MEQEISLREIIDTIRKGKWVIVIITVIAMLLSGIYSFFIVAPTYETNSLVRLQPSDTETNEKPFSLIPFVESLKSDSAITRIIDNLKLDSNVYSIQRVRGLIHLEVVKDTSVMKIKVAGTDPLLITNIANLVAYELGNRIEITERSQAVVQTHVQLTELLDKIKVSSNELAVAKELLEEIPEKQVTKQSLSEDTLLKDLIEEASSASVKVLAELQLENESINPTYNLLQSRITDLTISLKSLETDEANLRSRILEDNERIKTLESQLQQDKLSSKISDRLLNGYQAVFISPAIQQSSPVGPNKMMNIMIAAIVGVMIGTMVVFLRHYMRETSKPLTISGE